jgi:type III secretory pathway component EscT
MKYLFKFYLNLNLVSEILKIPKVFHLCNKKTFSNFIFKNFSLFLFLSTTLFTGMTSISLHLWLLSRMAVFSQRTFGISLWIKLPVLNLAILLNQLQFLHIFSKNLPQIGTYKPRRLICYFRKCLNLRRWVLSLFKIEIRGQCYDCYLRRLWPFFDKNIAT